MVQTATLPSILLLPGDTKMADRPPFRRRDTLVNGEDVTTWSDRELLVRAVNGVLETNSSIGKLTATISELERKHTQLEARVSKLEQRPHPSAHDLAHELRPAIEDAVEDAVEKTNPNLSTLAAAKTMLTEHELQQYKLASQRWWKVGFAILAAALAVVTSILTAVLRK